MADNCGQLESYVTLKGTSKSNVLECRVCDEVFALEGEKVPRLLHCGHTICHSCLLKLPLRDMLITCPFDRQLTHIDNSGIWSLKKNFALIEVLERLNEASGTAAKIFTSKDNVECEAELDVACDENDAHKAVLYCTVCESNLCIECSEVTHSTRTLAKHRRVPLSEKPKEKPKCPVHPSHTAEFTCLEEDCKSSVTPGRVMCFICKDYGRHKNHKHTLLEAEAESIRTSVAATVTTLKIFMESLNDTKRKIEQVIQHIEGTETQPGSGLMAKARVKVHFENLREELKVQEKAAMTVVDLHIRQKLCSLRQTQRDLANSLAEVASVCVQCEKMMQQDDMRILTSSQEIKDALASTEKTKSRYFELGSHRLPSDPSIPITFTKDNRVHIGPKIDIRVVTLGLDGAGKTSILFKLKQNEFMTMLPTIGFNIDIIEYKNVKFTVWDLGGQPKLRPLWKHYYFNTQAVIFVIDSSNRESLNEAHTEFVKLLSEKELKDAVILILANKQDIPDSMSVESLTECLAIPKLCCGRSWHMIGCSSQSGLGLLDGLDWIVRQLVASGDDEDHN
ncbi:UNVERIFIED_CONTAM: hypothetical protein PYX00_002498 [Menopon gallinae]|uniref:RING-type E3 ubiquitin transferase n=1 Tax=Menopon gallinae TaxID=328185 RepID=A0AAW2IID5_9NEOP